MSTIFDKISNNPVLSGLFVTGFFVLVGAVWKWNNDRRDSQKIYDFMVKSKSETSYTFRSTERISSDTNIPEKRVVNLCSKHPKIKRNTKEKQSWKLIS